MHARTTVRPAPLTSPLVAWLGVLALLLGTRAHAQALFTQEQLSDFGHNVWHTSWLIVAVVAALKRAAEKEAALLPNGLAVARTRYWFWWAISLMVGLWLAFTFWSGGYGGQLFFYHLTGVWAVLEFAVAATFLACGGTAFLFTVLDLLKDGLAGRPRASVLAPNASSVNVDSNVEVHGHESPDAEQITKKVDARLLDRTP